MGSRKPIPLAGSSACLTTPDSSLPPGPRSPAGNPGVDVPPAVNKASVNVASKCCAANGNGVHTNGNGVHTNGNGVAH